MKNTIMSQTGRIGLWLYSLRIQMSKEFKCLVF